MMGIARRVLFALVLLFVLFVAWAWWYYRPTLEYVNR
jgi:hypothetical protein